nr:transposase [Serpentinicella alkaliphila]
MKVNYKANPRKYGYPLRSSTEWKIQYNKRTSVERLNSRLNESLNVDNIRSKGIKKAKIHVLLNCISLIAGTIALNSSKKLKNVA